MVYCDGCGMKIDMHRGRNYCTRCGREIVPLPVKWQIRNIFTGPFPPPAGGFTELPRVNERVEDKPPKAFAARDSEKVPGTDRRTGQGELEHQSRTGLIQLNPPLQASIQTPKPPVIKANSEPELGPAAAHQVETSTVAAIAMLGVGVVSLILSFAFGSSVLALIGLGLTFWGALLLFIRPTRYVKSDLMDSTALSSLRTIDRVITSLGYAGKGVYLPTQGNPEKVVVFVSSQPNSKIPKVQDIEKQTFVDNPKGVVMLPPGLALANLMERKMGAEFNRMSLADLETKLPKLLIEDLEMVQDFDMRLEGDNVHFEFTESVYGNFCRQLRGSTVVCSSLGCPICSAMACILAQATGRPVAFDGDEISEDGRKIVTSYRLLAS